MGFRIQALAGFGMLPENLDRRRSIQGTTWAPMDWVTRRDGPAGLQPWEIPMPKGFLEQISSATTALE